MNVQFEENQDLRPTNSTGSGPQSKFVNVLLENGVAKNTTQATYILIIFSIVCIIIAFFMFTKSASDEEINFKNTPGLPDRS